MKKAMEWWNPWIFAKNLKTISNLYFFIQTKSQVQIVEIDSSIKIAEKYEYHISLINEPFCTEKERTRHKI